MRTSRLALLSFENYLLANHQYGEARPHIFLSAPEDRLTDVGRVGGTVYAEDGGESTYISLQTCQYPVLSCVCGGRTGRKINDSQASPFHDRLLGKLKTDLDCWNGADTEEAESKSRTKRVDASLGDVRHQVGNTHLKAVLESYRFPDFRCTVSAFHYSTSRRNRSGENTRQYTIYGIVYSVTDDTGKVVSRRSKFDLGKRFEMS